MLPVFSFVIKFANFEKKNSMTITKRRTKCYQTPEKLFSSLWFWWLICKTYLIFKICGKIDLSVKINWSAKMLLHGSWIMQGTGDSTNSFPTWHLRNWRKFSTNKRVSTQISVVTSQRYWISALILQELFLQGNHWWLVKCWLISQDVLYNSQLVFEWLRSLLLL